MHPEDWRKKADLTYRELGEKLGKETEAARRLCLPFGHRERRNPSPATIVRFQEISLGLVTAADFVEPATAKPRKRARAA